MHARVTRLQASADLLDAVVSQFEEQSVPVLEGVEGFERYILLADRGSGKAIAITYWESEEAMNASEEVGNQERDKAAKAAEAGSDPEVERYEVVSSS